MSGAGMGYGAEMDDELPWARLAGLIGLALLLTAVVAYRSLEVSSLYSRLSVPPLYDDVSYFHHAVKWMNAFGSRSVTASVWDLLHHHAPFSTLVAVVGLSLFPGSYIGPYLVHAVVVFAFLLGIILLTWKRPAVEIATCLVGAVCVPVIWHTVTEARPDLPSGLAVGFAAGAIVYRGVLLRSARSLVVLGIVCAIAASLKPTSFPASLVCLGSAFAMRLLADCIEAGGLRPSSRDALVVLLWFLLGLIATVALVLGPALVATVTYILEVFVRDRDIWTSGGESFWVGMLRFSLGGEGRFGLDKWLYWGLALMLFRLLLAAIRGRDALLDAAVLLATVLIAYVIPSVAEIKTYYFGALFYGIFIVAMALNFCANLAGIEALMLRWHFAMDTRRHVLASLQVLALAVVSFLFVKNVVIGQVSNATALSAQQRDDIRVATERLWARLREMKSNTDRPLYIGFTSPYPVTPMTVQLYAAQANMNLIVRQEFLHRTVEATVAALLRSDIIVVSSSIQHTLIPPRVGDEIIARLDREQGVCLLDSLVFPDVTLRVYRRGC